MASFLARASRRSFIPAWRLAAAERAGVQALVFIGIALIFVPLLLTLFLSVFDEKLILFPPHGYTVSWYGAILPNFGAAIATSLELGAVAVAGSLALGVPAGIALSRWQRQRHWPALCR